MWSAHVVLFYISWSRRLLEKVICEQSIEGRKGELRYLGEERWAAGGRSSKKAGTEASEWFGEGAGDGSRAVWGSWKPIRLGFLWEEKRFVHLWFPCPWILSLSINSYVFSFPGLLFFTFPQCKTSLDVVMDLWVSSSGLYPSSGGCVLSSPSISTPGSQNTCDHVIIALLKWLWSRSPLDTFQTFIFFSLLVAFETVNFPSP